MYSCVPFYILNKSIDVSYDEPTRYKWNDAIIESPYSSLLSSAALCNVCYSSHDFSKVQGLRTPYEAFFHQNTKLLRLGRLNFGHIHRDMSGSTHVPIGFWSGSSWNFWPLLTSVDALTSKEFGHVKTLTKK